MCKQSSDGAWSSRTELLLGAEGVGKLARSHVAVFGLGGVGSYVAEGLARAGLGHLTLVDSDTVSISNLNRQLPALTTTVGKLKTEVVQARIREINPAAEVEIISSFYLPERAAAFFAARYDYVVDAIDTVAAKIDLVVQCDKRQIPIISCMGAGNKLDPTRFEVADIYETSVDPLARVLRRKLKECRIAHLKVVYSREKPQPVCQRDEEGRSVPGSLSFVPSVAGLIMAGEVVRDLTGVQPLV